MSIIVDAYFLRSALPCVTIDAGGDDMLYHVCMILFRLLFVDFVNRTAVFKFGDGIIAVPTPKAWDS